MLTSAFLKQAVERKSVCSPFFDLLNHKPSLEANAQFQVAVQSDSGGVAASTNGDGSKSGRSIQVSATKNIPAGQQIFVSYIANSISSGKDDWYLLHRYGFCSSDGENATSPPHPQPHWQYIVDKAARDYGEKEAARMASTDSIRADVPNTSDGADLPSAAASDDALEWNRIGVKLCIDHQAVQKATASKSTTPPAFNQLEDPSAGVQGTTIGAPLSRR